MPVPFATFQRCGRKQTKLLWGGLIDSWDLGFGLVIAA